MLALTPAMRIFVAVAPVDLRLGINPQAYLTDVLRRLRAMNINRIGELLPGNWKPATP